jgi:L-ascorbate oxidase
MLLGILLGLSPLLASVLADCQVHDDNFVPDYVLEATLGKIQIDCQSRLSTTLNGTSPGPTLYLTEGKTTWIRVYNRMPSKNVTVVSVSGSRYTFLR